MKLVYLLEPGDVIQDKDVFFSPPIEAPEYIEAGEWKEINVATKIFAPSVSALEFIIARAVTNEALSAELVARHKSGELSEDELLLTLEQAQLLAFDGEQRMLDYVAEKYTIPKVLSHFSDYDVEQYVGSFEYAIDAMPENKGASFWKAECSQLLEEVIAKEGWDVIYNRIKDLDFMQPNFSDEPDPLMVNEGENRFKQ